MEPFSYEHVETSDHIKKQDGQTSSSTITEAFAAQVRATPHAIAVQDENRSLTYRQLDLLSDSITSLFPASSQFVGVIMDHGTEMIATLLAVLKTGAAYVPAEPSFPRERIRYMMDQCKASFVVTQKRYANIFETMPLVFVEKNIQADDLLADGMLTDDLLADDLLASDVAVDGVRSEARHAGGRKRKPVRPDSLAYVLYTSGTTGYPKGVMVEHRNVCHYVRAFNQEFKLQETDVMLQNSVCTFDIFVEEVFPMLLSGGSIAIPEAFTRSNFSLLMDFADRHKVTIISGFPYLLNELNKLDSLPGCIRLLISGGDVLRADHVTNLIKAYPVYNTYGPTETTVCATYFHCNGYEPLQDGTYPVGKPIKGVQVFLLDENLQSAKPGEIGEICIAGDGVSRGYLGNGSGKTSFVVVEDGQRFYRSGDLGRILPDGNLDFLKRNDEQVMIGGKRVEPQEVELVLERNDYIEHAVVTTEVDESGLAYLTAYLVPSSKDFHVSKLQEYLAAHVPEYMVPEYFVLLHDMPLTPNGKVDRRALPVVLKGGSL